MEDADERIARICTELLELQQRGSADRVARRMEMARLISRRDQREALWRQQVFGGDYSCRDLSVYRNALEDTSIYEGVYIPPLIATQQAQLCRHVHMMALAEKELRHVTQDTRRLVEKMEKEIRRQEEERANVEVRYLNQIFELERQIRETQVKLDEYQLIDPERFGNKQETVKQPEELDRKLCTDTDECGDDSSCSSAASTSSVTDDSLDNKSWNDNNNEPPEELDDTADSKKVILEDARDADVNSVFPPPHVFSQLRKMTIANPTNPFSVTEK